MKFIWQTCSFTFIDMASWQLDCHSRLGPCFVFFLYFGCTAFWIVVSQLGIKPVPPAVEAWSLNHWTTRELLDAIVLIRHGNAETHKLSSLVDTSPVTQRPSVMKPTIETKGHSNWPDWRAFLQANAGVPT